MNNYINILHSKINKLNELTAEFVDISTNTENCKDIDMYYEDYKYELEIVLEEITYFIES